MGRPFKQGIDYFPLDTNFLKDLKIRKIIKACGAAAPVVLISLLSNIYRDNGYYVVWDKDMPFLIADEIGVSEGAVHEVLKKAIQVGFFDEKLFKEHNVLTSRGVQARFLKAAERRKSITMFAEYNLVEFDSHENIQLNLVNVCNNPVNATQSTYKENESELKRIKTVPPQTGPAGAISGNSCEEALTAGLNAKCSTAPPEAKVYDKNGIPFKCAKYLADKILAVNPNAKVPKDDAALYKWCIHIDRLLRLDNKPPSELRAVLAFAVTDPFWSTNILSTKTFREKYDKLFAKMAQASTTLSKVKQGNMTQGGAKPNGTSQSNHDPYRNITSTDI